MDIYILVLLILVLVVVVVASSSASVDDKKKKDKFTSFQCIGGSQVLRTESFKQASVKVWPLNNPEFRTCKYRNICLVNGTLTYFSQHAEDSIVPKELLPRGFEGNVNHLSYLRAFTMPIHTIYGKIPADYAFHSTKIMFLDSNSWSFNYGHYLNDNVIPTFIAAKLFNVPFEGSQQLFESNCRLFSTLEPAFSDRLVTYNRSMGTYRHACLEKLDKLYTYFYDIAPIYADQLTTKSLCFDTMITGQGSSFGLKAIAMSRGYFFREFRDYVLKRIKLKAPEVSKEKDYMILVGLRTVGSAGGSIIHDLCDQVKASLQHISNDLYRQKYYVQCFVPSDQGFVQEIEWVQKAKIIISVHGTISYMSLFSRDGTIQLSIANPNELKENQMLLYATHFQTLYLTWDKMKELTGTLEYAISLSEANHQDD